MAPRPRIQSKKLPPNLSVEVKNGVRYYRYRHPETGKRTGIGIDEAKAVKAAIALNAMLLQQSKDRESSQLIRRVTNPEESISDFVAHFEEQILPGRRSRKGHRLAEKTLREYAIMLKTIDKEFGHRSWTAVTLEQVARFLDSLPPRSSNSHRSLMIQVWRHAIAKGKINPPTNLPEMTIPKDHVVERQPLSLELYRAIWEIADQWFRNAMDLALHTLQRREDLVGLRFDDIKIVDKARYLPVRQIKTEHSSDKGRLLLPIGVDLGALIERCRDDILSPFLIHKRPERRRREYLDRKEHWTQITPEMVTREFAALRDKCGYCDHLRAEQHPTFHEIRALGGELYRQAGWGNEAIQRLLGHTTEKMTRHYLDKHQEPWVVTDVVGLPDQVCRK